MAQSADRDELTMSTHSNDTSKQSTSFTARPQSSLLAVSASNAAEERERGTLASLSSLSFSNSNSVSVNPRSSVLRLTASETAAAEQSVETLKDLFWTLYSKLDAVLQGFRVSYEVALRISEVSLCARGLCSLPYKPCDPQRRDFKDASGVKSSSGNLLFSLLDVWKPVQLEVSLVQSATCMRRDINCHRPTGSIAASRLHGRRPIWHRLLSQSNCVCE